MKKFVLEPDVYRVKILIWLGPWSQTGINAFGRQHGFPRPFNPPNDRAAGCCYSMPQGALIWLPRFPRRPYEHGVLAHEAVHAAAHLGRDLGFELDKKSEEFYTYLVGYIVAGVHSRK